MLGIRHVALRVHDLKQSVNFYTVQLGMRVEWQPDAENAYLTTGSDNLALHQVHREANDHNPSVGLDHFGFIVSKPEEVDGWAERLETNGVDLTQKPKTHRDGARSVCFQDPDGNLVQILYHPPIS